MGVIFALATTPTPPNDIRIRCEGCQIVSVYQVRLLNRDKGLDRTLEVPEDEYILDIAEDNDIRLPSGCRQGNCSACVVKLICGDIDTREQKFLQPHELDEGYRLICVASPLSDCTIATHQEQVLYRDSLYHQ